MDNTNIKVVVRVRPFNEREKLQQEKGSRQCVVQMLDKMTTLIADPRYTEALHMVAFTA